MTKCYEHLIFPWFAVPHSEKMEGNNKFKEQSER